MALKALTITVDGSEVSGLLQMPQKARACYVLAHGAGAGMTHSFMTAIADGLGERGIATLRYQFPYMAQRRERAETDAARYAETCPSHGARGRRRSVALASGVCPSCRWQVIWRPHDVASAGQLTFARSSRPGVSRLSASPGRTPLR